MTLDEAEKQLGHLLAPSAWNEFAGQVLGQKFLHLNDETGRGRRMALLGRDPETALLNDYARIAYRLGSHAAEPLGPAPAVEPLYSPQAFAEKIAAFHARGYTVRMPAMRALTNELEIVTRALEAVFHQPAAVDIFWSRGTAKAPVHHDDCDLIVVHIKGHKRWHVSTDQSELPNAWRGIPTGPETLERFAVVEMTPGDLLYLPRGTRHRVEALSDSLHVSIGFTPVTLREALIACVDFLSDAERPLREQIEEQLARQLAGGDLRATSDRVRTAIDVLMRYCAAEGFIERALQRRSSAAISKLEKLPEPVTTTALTLATRLRQNPLEIHHLSGNSANIDFAFPGGHHYLHRGLQDAVLFVAHTSEFQIQDIPGSIDNDVKIALAEKLLKSGVLQLA